MKEKTGLITRFVIAGLLALTMAACANTLPKPTNANGSINPSVAVAEAEISYANAAHGATAYISTCHAVPSTIGCSETKIAQIKQADAKAYAALQAAEAAAKSMPAGGSGIDRYIAELNAALIFLQALLPTP